MSKVELNAREILYLSALAGATEFIGIPDGFYGMDELEIKQEILKIQSELEGKGYAQADFDGNFNPNDEVMEAVRTCALCEKYISVDKISESSSPAKLLFYFYNNKIIKVRSISDIFELTAVNSANINSYILEHINWITQGEKNAGSKVVIPQSLLAQVKDSTENFSAKTGVEELHKSGCDNIQAQIIYSGLTGTSNYYSVIIVDFNSEENDVQSIMVINSKSGSLEILPVDRDEKEAVTFHTIDYDTFKNKLTNILTLMGIEDRDGDFK